MYFIIILINIYKFLILYINDMKEKLKMMH